MVVYDTVRFEYCVTFRLRDRTNFEERRVPRDLVEQYGLDDDVEEGIAQNHGHETTLPYGMVCVEQFNAPDATENDENGTAWATGQYRVGDWLLWEDREGIHLEDYGGFNECLSLFMEVFDQMVARPRPTSAVAARPAAVPKRGGRT